MLSEDCESDSEASQRVSSSSSDLTQHSASLLLTPELTQHAADSQLQHFRTPPTRHVYSARTNGEKDLTQYQAHSTREYRESSIRSSPEGEFTQYPTIPGPSDTLRGSRTKDSRDLTQYPWRLNQSSDITQHSNYSGRGSEACELSLGYIDPTQYLTQQSLSVSDLRHRSDSLSRQAKRQGQSSPPVSQSASCRTSGVGSTFGSSTAELGYKHYTQTALTDVVGRSLSSAFYTPCSHLTSSQQTTQRTSPVPVHNSDFSDLNTSVSQLKSLGVTSSSSSVTPKAPCVSTTSHGTSPTSPLNNQGCKADIPTHSQSQSLDVNSQSLRRFDSSGGASKTFEATCAYKPSECSTVERGLLDSGLVLQPAHTRGPPRQTISTSGLPDKSSESISIQESDRFSVSRITLEESEWMPVSEDNASEGTAPPASQPAEGPDVDWGALGPTHQCDKSSQEGRDHPQSSGESGLGVSTETTQVSVHMSHLSSGSSFHPLSEDTCSSQNSSSSWRMSSPERAADQGDQGDRHADLSQSQVCRLAIYDTQAL